MGANISQDEALRLDEASAPIVAQDLGDEAKTNVSTLKPELPHNYQDILKDADSHIDNSTAEKLHSLLRAGVFLNNKRKKYWMDKTSKNCFMLFARDLSITWAENPSLWSWVSIKETSKESVDAAELLNVCWLEIHGRFQTKYLSPRVAYEAVFVVMLNDPAYGWEVPVNVRLSLPDGNRKEHKINLKAMPRGKWVEIPAGEFYNDNDGEIEFSMCEYEGGQWKRGLVIKGALVRPSSKVA